MPDVFTNLAHFIIAHLSKSFQVNENYYDESTEDKYADGGDGRARRVSVGIERM